MINRIPIALNDVYKSLDGCIQFTVVSSSAFIGILNCNRIGQLIIS